MDFPAEKGFEVFQQQKEQAALAAAASVKSGLIVGLGSGSTSEIAIRRIGERFQAGELDIRAVASSLRTASIAQKYGIPISEPDRDERIDLYIDGADQIDASGRMIKGGGGALLREKIVAYNANHRVIVVDSRKPVEILGRGFPLPVDIARFCALSTCRAIEDKLGCNAVLRRGPDGKPFTTDDGHYIADCEFAGGIADPESTAIALDGIPGVLEYGLFVGFCDELIIGTETGVERRVFRKGTEASA